MVLHAEGGGPRPPALPRGQCRRERARHLQGPGHDAPRPPETDRGVPALRLRHAGPCRLHLHSRRVLRRGGRASGGDRRGLRRGPHRQEPVRHRLALRRLSAPRRRRLHLRRGDRAARKPGGQAGQAAPQAALPGGGRALRLPVDGEQRRDHRGRTHHPGAARSGSPVSAGPRTPAPRFFASPATSISRATWRRRWASPCAS